MRYSKEEIDRITETENGWYDLKDEVFGSKEKDLEKHNPDEPLTVGKAFLMLGIWILSSL